jgi:uncharacterized coiled-coil protein SlyX
MTDDVENLMLEHVKRFQASLDRVEHKISELTVRFANLESGQSLIMQHLAHFSAADAAQQVAIDRIGGRLDRIERRLEIAN